MVLTKEQLIASLQNEVRILLHLVSKVDRAKLDYRPTARQRSTIELLRYMSFMGPEVARGIVKGAWSNDDWTAAETAAAGKDLDAVVAAIAAQPGQLAALLAGVPDADFGSEVELFPEWKATKGSFLVNMVLCGYAAYRTQLFCYLKSCGRDELNTMNLWAGVDGPMEAAASAT